MSIQCFKRQRIFILKLRNKSDPLPLRTFLVHVYTGEVVLQIWFFVFLLWYLRWNMLWIWLQRNLYEESQLYRRWLGVLSLSTCELNHSIVCPWVFWAPSRRSYTSFTMYYYVNKTICNLWNISNMIGIEINSTSTMNKYYWKIFICI